MDIEHPYKRRLLQEENALFQHLITKEDIPFISYELNEQDKMFVEKRYAFLTSDTGLSILYTVLPLPIEDMILILAYIKDNFTSYFTPENKKYLYSILTSIFKELNQLLIERTAKTYNAIKKNDINLDEKIYSFDTIFSPMPIPNRAEYLYTQLNAFNKIYALSNNILQKLLLVNFNQNQYVNKAFTNYLSDKQMSQFERTNSFDNFSQEIFNIKNTDQEKIFLQSYNTLAKKYENSGSKNLKNLLLIAGECKNNFIRIKMAFSLLSDIFLQNSNQFTEGLTKIIEPYFIITTLIQAINIHPIFYIIYLEEHLTKQFYIAKQQEEIIYLTINSLEYFFRNENVIKTTDYLDDYRTRLCTIIQKYLPNIFAKESSYQEDYRPVAQQAINKITASKHKNTKEWIDCINRTVSNTQ